MVLVADGTKMPDIYSRTADKSKHYITGSFGTVESVFNMQDQKTHYKYRKIAAEPYGFGNIKRMEPLMDVLMEQWITKLDQMFAQTGDKFDFAPWSIYLAYDIIGDIGFGGPFGFVEHGKDPGGLIDAFHQGSIPFGLMARLYPLTNIIKKTFLGKYMVARPDQTSGAGVLMRFRDRLLAKRLEDIEKGNLQGRVDLLQT